MQQTTQATGYHQANHTAMTQFSANTQATFKNFAHAVWADWENLKGLTEANNALLLPIQEQDKQMQQFFQNFKI